MIDQGFGIYILLANPQRSSIAEVLSALSPSQQPTGFFSIDQNSSWTIKRLVNETIQPATQRIILKIVGFYIAHCKYFTKSGNFCDISMNPVLLSFRRLGSFTSCNVHFMVFVIMKVCSLV